MLSIQKKHVYIRVSNTYSFEDFNLSHRFVLSGSDININDILFGAEWFFQNVFLWVASSDTPLKLEFPLYWLRHICFYLFINKHLLKTSSNCITSTYLLLSLSLGILRVRKCGNSLLLILVGVITLQTLWQTGVTWLTQVTGLLIIVVKTFHTLNIRT